MGSPSKNLILAEDTLRILAQHLIDSQEGLKKIGEEVKNESLKQYFLAESLKRAQFRGELENMLHQSGERDLNLEGTAEGAFIRAWTGLKSALGAGDGSLLASAEEGEHGTMEAYAEALRKDLPLPVRDVLAQQAAHIVESHDCVRSAREEHK